MTKLFALTRKQTVGLSTVVLVLAASAGLAIAAPAAPPQGKPGASTDPRCGPGHRGHDPFARWDQDKDGKIVLKDLPAKPQAHLATLDTNKDGVLTREEFDANRQARFATRFAEDDKNKDGFLVQTEVPQRWSHLKQADANNDGKVSLAELKTAFESGKMSPPERGQGRGKGHGHGPKR